MKLPQHTRGKLWDKNRTRKGTKSNLLHNGGKRKQGQSYHSLIQSSKTNNSSALEWSFHNPQGLKMFKQKTKEECSTQLMAYKKICTYCTFSLQKQYLTLFFLFKKQMPLLKCLKTIYLSWILYTFVTTNDIFRYSNILVI